MIRYLSVICKLNQLMKSDMDMFFTVMGAYFLFSLVCPGCGAKGCSRNHMSYERWVITVEGGTRREYSVNIPCVLCESCGRLHAILPDILIPYSSYSLRFILHVLEEYLKRTCTVETFCYGWGIAVSTLYAWKHRFLEQINLWIGKLERFSTLVLEALAYIRDVDSFPSRFFGQFKFSFLGHKNTTQYQNSS